MSIVRPRSRAVPVASFLTALGFVLLTVASTAHEAHSPRPPVWGATGHRTIGYIAESHLSPTAREMVQSLIGPENLVHASTWPDDIRSDPAWYHAAPWHYVTIEDGETYETSDKNPNGDAIEATRRFIATLADENASTEDRAIALRWITHLVGDLHMPLHVGRGADRGGNDIDVTWFGEDTNQHRLWDSDIIDSTQLSYTELADHINHPTPEQVEAWQSAELMDWVQESYDLRDVAYNTPGPSFGDSYVYRYENLPVLHQRLLQSGVRLAGLLNDLFPGTATWDGMPNSTHYQRNAAEYQALTRQIYRAAARSLRDLHEGSELPAAGTWCVAMDADETIVDNSQYAVERRGGFDPVSWDAWCNRREATAVPGAVTFMALVKELGGNVCVVSNRSVRVQDATEDNLRALGAPFDVVLLKDEDGEKEPRWQQLRDGIPAANLPPQQIVLFIGDNITDFPDLDQSLRHGGDAGFAPFGTRYFVVPNPGYGSFTSNARE